ncbi:hypothetical protein F5148DRAFT_1336592 [Russula earlei]|uniref:Uncharacterized protein n=1 Tax=Russula earlei TaxID=71964 RepID=A0ACC0TW72_9AGAM|nr:hypothetical protein F5148DRAFT_1336592 [Russula earlei]
MGTDPVCEDDHTSLSKSEPCGVVSLSREGMSVGCVAAVAAAVYAEVMVARVRVVGWCLRVRVMGDGGDGEEGEGGSEMAGSSPQQVVVGCVDDSMQPLQVVAARMDEGVHVGGDAMEGEVWCSVVLALAASPLFVLSFLVVQGGVMASDRSSAKMLVGEAEAMGVVVHEMRTGVAMGDVEAIGNAEAEAGSTEAVADMAERRQVRAWQQMRLGQQWEMVVGEVADKMKVGVADEAEVAAGGGANSAVVAVMAGDAGNTMVDKTGMTVEGGETVGKVGGKGMTGAGDVEVMTGNASHSGMAGTMGVGVGDVEVMVGELNPLLLIHAPGVELLGNHPAITWVESKPKLFVTIFMGQVACMYKGTAYCSKFQVILKDVFLVVQTKS